MGFYLRKSVSVGPFRFNLSKSGVGVSAGVKGFRIGTGPRGNYVHMGLGGIYYRATIPPASTSQHYAQPSGSSDPVVPYGTHGPLEEIESADVSQIVDSSSQELLNELNDKQQKVRLWPFAAAGLCAIMIIGLLSVWPVWSLVLLAILSSGIMYLIYSRDVLAKTVVLFYDFDPEMEQAYGLLHSKAEQMSECAAAWHIEAEGKVHDPRYHAGASGLVRRKSTFIRKSDPPFLKTNIETVSIGVGRQTLHFFPDRILVYDSNGVGAVGYKELRMNVQPRGFIESEGVPRDAKVIDRTWKYVNKSGKPDRRFKDNTELPVCLYDEMSLTSATGLNESIQISKTGIAQGFADAILYLAKKTPKELKSPAV